MRDGVESLGRVRTKGVAILAITFLVGGLAGAAVERARATRPASEPLRPGAGMMRPFREGWLPPLFENLGLTADQRTQIIDIMEQGRPRTDQILREMLPRLRTVTDSIHEQVRAVLTPEQLVQFDSLMSEMRPGPRRGRRGLGRRDWERTPPPLYPESPKPHLP